MKTATAFTAAVPLALILVALVIVVFAITPGAFSFERWPEAPAAALSEREVVVDVPAEGRSEPRADARRAPRASDRADLVARAHEPPPGRVLAPRRVLPGPTALAEAAPEPRVPAAQDPGPGPQPPRGDQAIPPQEPVALPAEEILPAKDLPALPIPIAPAMDEGDEQGEQDRAR